MCKYINVYRDGDLHQSYSFDADVMTAETAGEVIRFAFKRCAGVTHKALDMLIAYDVRPLSVDGAVGVGGESPIHTSYLESKAKACVVEVLETGARFPAYVGIGEVCPDIDDDVICWAADDDEFNRLRQPGNGRGFRVVGTV